MQDQVTDRTMPTGRWEFDAKVTAVFDDMLNRSIPHYGVMREACRELGSRFIRPGTDVVDLGCSRGESMAPFVRLFGGEVRHVGLECSLPMLEASRARYPELIRSGVVEIREHDLRDPYPSDLRASLTLAVLTIQFTPIEFRQQILAAIARSTVPGGALILVEKVLGESAELDDAFVALYLDHKARSGYSAEAIAAKRSALQGALVPLTDRWNRELLRSAGFTRVDCFWRWFNFAAWVAIRD